MRTREFIRFWHEYSEAVVQGDLERMLSFFTEDAVFVEPRQPPLHGRAAIAAYLARAAARPVEFRPTWHRFVVNGDEAAIEFTFLFVRPDTGRRFSVRGVIICELRHDRICYLREYFDSAELSRPATGEESR